MGALQGSVYGLNRRYDVTLCGYYGFGNLGDELLALSLKELICQCGIPEDRIAMFSADPERTSAELGIDCYNRWDLRSLCKGLRRSRSLLFGGGGLFQDTTSTRSCIYYWGIARLALLMGARPWMFGQSVGPLNTSTGKLFAKNAISRCKARGVRDRGSINILQEWGLDSISSPDPVFTLHSRVGPEEETGNKETLLVNVRPWHNDLASELVETISDTWKGQYSRIIFVALSAEDETLAEEFAGSGKLPVEDCSIERVASWEDVKRVWGRAGAAIGMRLHFCILSFIFSVPCVAVPYDPKVSYFANNHGIPCWVPGGAQEPLVQTLEKQSVTIGDEELKLKQSFDKCLKIVLGAVKNG